MEIKVLQDRIQKTKDKIEKIEKRIKKWQDARTREAFLKVDGWLLNSGRDENFLYQEYLNECNHELDRASQELYDTKVTLQKYENMLEFELNKDKEFENNRVDVIWQFLLNWKDYVAESIRNNMSVLNDYYKKNDECCEWQNNKYLILKEENISEEEWKEHYRKLREEERQLYSNVHPYTKLVAKHDCTLTDKYCIDETNLNILLTKDVKAKYWKLIDEVTEITGNITDANNLNTRGGELNGIIIGENGTANVQTFSAGGWNVQCFHLRHKITRVS